MKHSLSDLKQMQSLPLDVKVEMTRRRVREWYEGWNGDIYLAFSGGKDSTVLKHIVDDMYDDVPSVFVNTGLEYPEIQKFVSKQKNAVVIRPKMRFDEVILKYGYPIISKETAKNIYYARYGGETNVHYEKLFGIGRFENSRFATEKWSWMLDAPFKISAMCCDAMKKRPSKKYQKETGRQPMVATLAEESLARQSSWTRLGCNTFDTPHPRSMPLAFWTEQDILHYIVKNNIPICSVYGAIRHKQSDGNAEGQIDLIDSIGYEDGDRLEVTGCNRTGCIFCGFGCHLEKAPNRFQRLKKTHPRQWEYCIKGGEWKDGLWQPSKEGLGMWYVLDYIGVKYE